jgi:hypothetical protein
VEQVIIIPIKLSQNGQSKKKIQGAKNKLLLIFLEKT